MPLKGLTSTVLNLSPKEPKDIIEKVGACCISDLVGITSFSVLIGAESLIVESD